MNNVQENQIKNEVKGRGLFYGVIAIATFIIMAVGATFAYFTATTHSMNSSVKTGSTTLQLKYISYETGWMNNDLIPADTTIVEYSFENQNDTTMKTITETGEPVVEKRNALCKDDFGNSICSVYVFQVTNSANSPQSVSLDVVSETNEFASLNAMAYEISLPEDTSVYESTENNNGKNDPSFTGKVDESIADKIDVIDGDGGLLSSENFTPIYINRAGINKTLLKYVESRDTEQGTTVMKPAINRLLVPITEDNQYAEPAQRTTRIADDITINGGGTTKTFALVLYIKNANVDQTATDAAKTFTGQVIVGSGDGTTGVSGTISAYTDGSDLQSNQGA